MADAGYRIAPIFLIRMAGVPFEVLEKLATPETAAAAREFLSRQREFLRARSAVKAALSSRREELPLGEYRALKRSLRSGIIPSALGLRADSKVAVSDVASPTAEMIAHALARDLEVARKSLFESAHRYLPPYLVFAAAGVRERVTRQLSGVAGPLPPRNKQARADERHFVLYLQRVAGKNDSLSEFGPEGWGTISSGSDTLRLDPRPGIAGREVFLERWTAHGVAAAINADPATKGEIAPRLNPNGRLEEDRFINSESGETISVSPELHALLASCDGKTPAYSLGASLHTLSELASQNLIRWELEVPALEPHAFQFLLADVSSWRDTSDRARWTGELIGLIALKDGFARTTDPESRLALIQEATRRLQSLGATKIGTRFLYSATNPIGEECVRECNFSIGESLINEVATEATPWIDLWRDNYAFVASRVAAGLRGLLEQMPRADGAVPLPAFLRHCEQMKMPLTGPGMVVFAHLAFQEVKDVFRARLEHQSDASEYQLTSEDCHVIRQNREYERFDEFTFPSADLQLAAESVEAVARGDYQWVLAELHPSAALLHHGFYWSCPDKAALNAALKQTLFGKPNFHFGYFAADFTATTAVRLDALGNSTNFVAPQRSAGKWQSFSPADAEVFVSEQSGDVGLRLRGSRTYLGSFARGWVIPLGFHPFNFSLGRNTPRLLCGKVVVQRRTWTVALEELGAGDFTGISRDLVLAVERLRAARQLSRHIYIRPTEQALRRSGVEGRDKDTKPVYIDLESYLFLEIFHRWLTKAGELEVTEMLPSPDQLLWREPDGRRTFELRTQIIPR